MQHHQKASILAFAIIDSFSKMLCLDKFIKLCILAHLKSASSRSEVVYLKSAYSLSGVCL